MSLSPVSESDVERLYLQLKEEATTGGYHLNPDVDFTKNLIRGLLRNDQRYSYRACPCRLATGRTADDLDIVCPCDYRDADLEEFGACYCALYVSPAIAKGEKQAAPVPERRPPRSERGKNKATQVVPTGPQPVLSLPVWRCKVCGYLCAREQPPSTCPICKVSRDRFERFM
ncbi:MAG: ferredoxin:glutaredoxin reductase [Methanomicrobiales archaeon]|nr:ferredoxin:glutaredoxin reductase [Methanomicrobiales archaeon]